MTHSRRVAIYIAVSCVLAAGPAIAGTIRVSSNGTDGAGCGTGANPPCATIAQAVTNAADGDSILVGAGSYAGTTIDKTVSLWSSIGNGGASITSTMTLAADGIGFGKAGKGFAFKVGPGFDAIVVTASSVTVRGNLISSCNTGVNSTGTGIIVRDNVIDNCTTGIFIGGADAEVRGNRMGYISNNGVLLGPASTGADVRENRMFGPGGTAVAIGGASHLIRRNLVQACPYGFGVNATPSGVTLEGNLAVGTLSLAYNLNAGTDWVLIGNASINAGAPGFYLTAGTPFTLIGNVAIGNAGYGIFIASGSNHVLEDNTAIDNQYGIFLAGVGTGVKVSGGNIYGNTSGNCGLSDSSSSAVTASKIYWGAPSGPGADPADDLCENTAAITVEEPASKAATIKMPSVK